jgi:hypothetical protein
VPLVVESACVTQRHARLARRVSQLSGALLVSVPILAMLVAGLEIGLSLPFSIAESVAWTWLLGVPVLTVAAAITSAVERPGRATITAGEDGLTLAYRDDERRIGAAAIASGLVTPAGLDLQLTNGSVLRAEMREDEAISVLDALGVGPDRRRAALMMGREGRPLAAGCGAFVAAIVAFLLLAAVAASVIPAAVALLGALLMVLAPHLARAYTAPASLTIGADGVTLRHAYRTRRIPFAAIHRADPLDGRLVLTLTPTEEGGPAETIRLPGGDPELAAGAAKRILSLKQAPSTSASQAIPDLDPAGRTLPAWREALSRLRRADGEYRRAQVRDDALLAVLEDGAAPAKLRLGAALALREGDAPAEARARVRIAAETSADEELRAALEAAAEEKVKEAPLRRVVRRKEG